MSEVSEFHLHIHEGATPEAVRAAVEAYRLGASEDAAVGAVEREADRVALAERAYQESDGSMKPLLGFLADNPDRLVPYTEASAILGFPSARSMPGLLGAFGRRANHRYGGQWPFEKVWHEGAWQMRMGADIAQAIRALRSS
jgi:hypothetical protein